MSGLRVFIAIEFPAEARAAILSQTASMRRALPDSLVRWVAEENLHLTLKFLGDVPPGRVDAITAALTKSAAAQTGFAMQLEGVGSFPTPKRPRLIWAGIHAPQGLAALQSGVDSAMARLGFPAEERPFSPHLTIGRVRQPVSPSDLTALRAAVEQAEAGEPIQVGVEAVHLFKSDLRAGGSIYTKLFSAPLKS